MRFRFGLQINFVEWSKNWDQVIYISHVKMIIWTLFNWNLYDASAQGERLARYFEVLAYLVKLDNGSLSQTSSQIFILFFLFLATMMSRLVYEYIN
jgi:hypothetical protein